MAANNSSSPPAEFYSTLELDDRPQYNNQAPEVAFDRENLPEVNNQANLPEVNQQAYSATYSSGGYTPVGAAGFAAKEDGVYVGDQAAAATEAKDPRICGVRRKTFIILATLAALVVVGIIVGVAVGVTVGNNRTDGEDGQPAEDGDSSSTEPTPIGPPTNVRLDTRIASTNFTDDAGNNNYVLIYQLNSGALWYVQRRSLPPGGSFDRVV